jgi:aryl carrier-like protein
MTYEDWEVAVLPKVQGTFILHEALKNSPIDWFVLFSSFSGIIGQWNQANYAAANTFLDAFVQYRHRLGLPASVLDLGVVEDHGYMSRSAELTANFKNWGAQTVQEQDLLDAVQLSIESSMPSPTKKDTSKTSFLDSVEYVERSQLILGLKTSKRLSDPSTRVRWRRDRRMSIYHNDSYTDVQSENRADYAELEALLKNVSDDPTILANDQNVRILIHAIGLKICDLMLLSPEDLDTSASLADVGVDSLIVMEIRSWWKSTFRFSVSTLEFLSCISINEVGQLAANGLLKLNSEKAE